MAGFYDLPMMGAQGMMDPLSAYPEAPPATRPGGLGGLGGFLGSPQGGNMMSALGMSLLSSPRNNPLENFGKFGIALQDRTIEAEDRQRKLAQEAEAQAADAASLQRQQAFYESNFPDLAPLVGTIPGKDLFEIAMGRKKGAGFINLGDGKLFNQDTGEVIQPGGDEYSERERAAARYGLTPESPGYESFMLTGKMPREDAQPLTATDKKQLWASEDEIPNLDNTIGSLDRALELNDKTYTGLTAGLRGTIGTNVDRGGYLFDPDTAKATSEFNKIMSMEAITAMAQTLKGATTDSELARFVSILADPSTDPTIRKTTIERMKTLAERQKAIKVDRINEIRGQGAAPKVTPSPELSAPTGSGVKWRVVE